MTLQVNAQAVPVGMTNNTEVTLASPVDMPTVINTTPYPIKLSGKLRVNTAQALPANGTDGDWSIGAIQFGNATSDTGKVTINGVQCPFTLTITHTTTSTDAARKLRVMFGANEVYLAGSGATSVGMKAVLDSTTTSTTCTSGSIDVEAYGWNGTQGSGVRIFDIKIVQ